MRKSVYSQALSVVLLICAFIAQGSGNQSVKYVLEGKEVILECRIPRPLTDGARLYWMGPVNGTMDNYAIDNATFNKDYSVDLRRSEGRYDLKITRATYDRNNGVFICRVKQEGTGLDLHFSQLNLTVLIKPGSPRITPQHPTATQGHAIRLTCASQGGSPDPTIIWYRKSTSETLQSVLKPGGGRDFPTTSILTVEPRKEDDGEEFLCEVRNMALSEDEKMVSSVNLNVDYYPIVSITPSNPVRVIEGEDVTLRCDVDAKPAVQNVRWMRGGAFIQTTNSLFIQAATLDDAGRYICQADNRLGRPGEAEVTVDVLYPPTVSVPTRREVSSGENVVVTCNVTANPSPDFVYWTKVGNESFKQNGELLRLVDVSSADHGDYVCHAISLYSPSRTEDKITLRGNATLGVRIRHAPGKSYMLPSQPVAVIGKSAVLTCGADPPGYPDTKYRWWRDDIVMEMGSNYSIPVATRAYEGSYFCQPFNLMGNGSVVSAILRVFQPPRILEGLKPTAVHRREITDLRLSCRAQGKPKPVAKWYKDGKEIEESDGLFVILVNYTELDPEAGFVVQSTLSFHGPERVGQKGLRPEDRGKYECSFENEAEQVKSAQLLRIQHPPSTAHRQNKVAFNVGDHAYLICLMRAYPEPSFDWKFNRAEIPNFNSDKYTVNNTDLGDDLYVSTLNINSITEEDYGAYTCKAANEEGPTKTILSLERKGKPAPPENLRLSDAGVDFLEVTFEEGFDGGYPQRTNYSVQVTSNVVDLIVPCETRTLCRVDGLIQNTEYRIRLYAENPEGQSKLSEPILAKTTLDPNSIPAPNQVFTQIGSGTLVFAIPDSVDGQSAMTFEGRIEIKYQDNSEWTKVPGAIPVREGRGNYELGSLDDGTDVRVQLCAKNSLQLCGPFSMARQVSELPQQLVEAGVANNIVWIIVIIIVVAVVIMALAVIACCCCRQQRNSKLKKKTADMEVSHRGVVTQQAPPPPYYTVGMENKGMEGSIDRLNDHSKALIYGSQQQYQNYPQNHPMHQQQQQQQQQHPQHQQQQQHPNGMAYMDNSYSNSNNGGSVNSQDSLWQVKGHPNDGTQMISPQHQMDPAVDPRNPYNQYNPMVHGGYGITGYDDYAHYPPMSQHPNMQDDYARSAYNNSNNDPYGVHKPRGMDTIDDGYDVSDMPNPYLESHHNPNHQGVPQMAPDAKPQISFDESLESGFSTPNSKNRRIIREIIV